MPLTLKERDCRREHPVVAVATATSLKISLCSFTPTSLGFHSTNPSIFPMYHLTKQRGTKAHWKKDNVPDRTVNYNYWCQTWIIEISQKNISHCRTRKTGTLGSKSRSIKDVQSGETIAYLGFPPSGIENWESQDVNMTSSGMRQASGKLLWFFPIFFTILFFTKFLATRFTRRNRELARTGIMQFVYFPLEVATTSKKTSPGYWTCKCQIQKLNL